MNKDDSIGQKDYGRMFVMLQILALVPNIVNFFRGVLAGAFRQDLPWPRKNALVMVRCALDINCFSDKCFNVGVLYLPITSTIHI